MDPWILGGIPWILKASKPYGSTMGLFVLGLFKGTPKGTTQQMGLLLPQKKKKTRRSVRHMIYIYIEYICGVRLRRGV